jgi:hypothetical protein
MVEVKLSAGDARMQAKVPLQKGVQVGNIMRLSGSELPDLWWRIDWVSEPFNSEILKRGWDNNI